MKAEILYLSGCPNHSLAVRQVQQALREEGLTATLVEVEVKDPATAIEIGFLGSPSIRINGKDIEHSARFAQTFGMMCRIYVDDGRRAGLPPMEWIRAALREARGDVGWE
jgi:hypothetical protein